MKKILILWILITPSILFGQKEIPQLFESIQIKADIDILISKLKDIHPTFLNYYKANNLQSRIDSIKNKIDNFFFISSLRL